MIWLPYCHEYSSNTTRHGKAAIFITDVDGDVLARVRVGARVCSRAAGEIDVIQRAKEKCAVDRQSRDFVIVQAPPLRHMHCIFSPTQLLQCQAGCRKSIHRPSLLKSSTSLLLSHGTTKFHFHRREVRTQCICCVLPKHLTIQLLLH